MLASDHHEEVSTLLRDVPCKIQLPEEWQDTFFHASGMQPTSFDERRRFIRFNLRMKGLLHIRETLPSMTRTERMFVIYTCNVARAGVGFLHFEQMFPGERCELLLPTRKIEIEIAQCSYIGPKCYMVGAKMGAEEKATPLG